LIPLKAVIFDYGNVLSRPQTMEDMAAMALVAGVGTEDMHRAYWRFRPAFDRGDLDEASYWKAVATAAGRSLTAQQRLAIISLDNESWSREDPAMVRWAATLRDSGIRTGVLSNMPVTLRRHVMSALAWLKGFDNYTFSCDVHLIKPETGIYEHAVQALEVNPAEALFLDDREENVAGARRAGLHALTFQSVERAREELARRYAIPPIQIQPGRVR